VAGAEQPAAVPDRAPAVHAAAAAEEVVLKIHETTRADGSLGPVHLRRDDDGLALVSDDGVEPLPDGALAAVMRRFARAIEPSLERELVEVAALDLGGGARLRHVRHLARYDVIARDWLVLEAPGQEPSGALATTVAGALSHLARAFRAV
jgi:hypothetical protein